MRNPGPPSPGTFNPQIRQIPLSVSELDEARALISLIMNLGRSRGGAIPHIAAQSKDILGAKLYQRYRDLRFRYDNCT